MPNFNNDFIEREITRMDRDFPTEKTVGHSGTAQDTPMETAVTWGIGETPIVKYGDVFNYSMVSEYGYRLEGEETAGSEIKYFNIEEDTLWSPKPIAETVSPGKFTHAWLTKTLTEHVSAHKMDSKTTYSRRHQEPENSFPYQELLSIVYSEPDESSRAQVPKKLRLDLRYVWERLNLIFPKDQVFVWLQSNNFSIGGRPIDAIALGNTTEVMYAIDVEEQGAFG